MKICVQEILDDFNNTVGDRKGVNCPKCKNKGWIRTWVNGKGIVDVECECMAKRNAAETVAECGLGGRLEKCKFTTFKKSAEWQRKLYDAAYLSQYEGNGFFVGGQPGSGKTHICIALVRAFMDKGVKCKYVGWQDLATTLKQSQYDDSENFAADMRALKEIPVLFIDDLFRTAVSDADRRLLFSIIDYRYNKVEGGEKVFTIFSSEKWLDEINKIDEAIGRRIETLAGEYVVNIPRDKRYKYRKEQK